MKRVIEQVLAGLLVAAVLLPALAYSQEGTKAGDVKGKKAEQAKEKKAVSTDGTGQSTEQAEPVIYRPPQRGIPGGRVGGGTRGTPTNLVELFVLAPDHVATTTKADPDLYWYISVSTEYPLEVSISEDQAVKPLLERRITPPIKPGLNRISLKDAGIKLLKGAQYRWFVALVPDESRRSKDLVAGSIIEYIDAPPDLKGKLSAAQGKEWGVYAQQGIWYDAIMALSEAIMARPDDEALIAQRDNLLAQVGLRRIGHVR